MDQQLIMQNNKDNSSTQNNKNIEKKKKIFHTNASILNLTKNFKSQYHT